MEQILKNKFTIFLFLVSAFLLNSCNLIHGSGQSEIKYQDLELRDGLTYGQSFYAKHNGLQAVSLYLTPGMAGDGEIQLLLRHKLSDTENLDKISIKRSQIVSAGYYTFEFLEPSESYLKGFFALIDYEGDGSVILGSADSNSYEDGAAYLNGDSFPRQLSFNLSYSPKPMLLSLVKLFFTKWLPCILFSILLFILPGYAILDALNVHFEEKSFVEKIVFSIGLSLSITPIFFLWTNLVGVKLGVFYAIIPLSFSVGYLIYKAIKSKAVFKNSMAKELLQKIEIPDLILLFLILVLIFIRFWIIRPLPLPLWGDSYQHTLITQLLFENNGLFKSWLPYADIPRFTYHFGFHSNAAIFKWISGETAAQAVLVFGQVINIFSIIVLYPMARFLSPNKNKWAGVVAVLIGGFILKMPNFYTNWGRYTQLIGQVVLLPSVLFLWKIFTEEKFHWKYIAVASLMIAGLAFSHYRVLVIFILFIPVLLVTAFRNNTKQKLLKISLIASFAFILFLPWFINAFGGSMVESFVTKLKPAQTSLGPTIVSINPLRVLEYSGLFNYISKPAAYLLLVIIVFFVFKKNLYATAFMIWWIFAFIAGFPSLFNLPGKEIISGFTILIALFIPLSVMVGSFIGTIFLSNAKFKDLTIALSIVICIFLAIWFGRQRLYDIDPSTYALVTYPDLEAANWINENIPDSEKIFINSFAAYNNTAIVGSDGGWWLPYLIKNQTNVPPLNYMAELNNQEKINIFENEKKFWEMGLNSEDVKILLFREKYNYVFIGQKQGGVNNPGGFLNSVELMGKKDFVLAYEKDNVRIFNFTFSN